MKYCLLCGQNFEAKTAGAFHPDCIGAPEWTAGLTEAAENLKQEVTKIILWADSTKDRSVQKEIGPSELGDPCDRRLAYRLAEIPEVSRRVDPWAAIVGTAIHEWMRAAIDRWCRERGIADWKTEETLQIDSFVIGHSDAYWQSTVIDWKTKSTDRMREIRLAGAAAIPGEIVQAHIYGYGYAQRGYPVMNVALVCLPRSGRLRDAVVIVEQYDHRIAEYALKRMYEIVEDLVRLNVYTNPSAWADIPATPTDTCGLCPWYDPNRLIDADNTGCPGR